MTTATPTAVIGMTTMSKFDREAILRQMRKPKAFDKEWIEFAKANIHDSDDGEPEYSEIEYGKHFADWVWRAFVVNARTALTTLRADPERLQWWKEQLADRSFYLPAGTEERMFYRAYGDLVLFGRERAIQHTSNRLDHFHRWLVANVSLKRPTGMPKISPAMQAFLCCREKASTVYHRLHARLWKKGRALIWTSNGVNLCRLRSDRSADSDNPIRSLSFAEFAAASEPQLLRMRRTKRTRLISH